MKKPKITVQVQLDDRGDHWAGWIEGVGTYVYADTVEGLVPKVLDVVDALMVSFDPETDKYMYMLRQGLQFQVAEDPPLRLAVSRELVPA
jgi:hypothetical protein